MFYYKAILKESVLYYFYKETNIVVHVVENKRKIKILKLKLNKINYFIIYIKIKYKLY